MNKQIVIVIVMVVAMLYFMVSIVEHFTSMNQAQKDQEAARRDSLVDVQIEHLTNDNAVLREAVRSQGIRLDGLQTKTDNINYKLNRMLDQ